MKKHIALRTILTLLGIIFYPILFIPLKVNFFDTPQYTRKLSPNLLFLLISISITVFLFIQNRLSFLKLSISNRYLRSLNSNKFSASRLKSNTKSSDKHKKTGFTTFKKIDTYIIENKRYLSPDINLLSLANRFEISKGYLSQLINNHTNTNFNDYINTLRIEASKKMLLDTSYNNYTIESIGLECGFKSKSNFYNAFKKFTGSTPNQFKKISSESSTS
ncbi:helix-turn-helix domain-containing protein [Aquimarina acroporae]|uniref:helix-turn-helix domain-containing protein n=1 Tax=Aquimarina acroporae TaxID=2937283 RepID=UPI00374D51D5